MGHRPDSNTGGGFSKRSGFMISNLTWRQAGLRVLVSPQILPEIIVFRSVISDMSGSTRFFLAGSGFNRYHSQSYDKVAVR